MLALFVILAKMNKLGCCACVGWGWCEVEFMFLMVTHIYIHEVRVTMGDSGLCYVSVTAF